MSHDIGKKIICNCGEKTVFEAIELFGSTTLPYKKAKKLVTCCNRTCCRKPLMRLFDMIEYGEIDFEEIGFLIDKMNRMAGDEENE